MEYLGDYYLQRQLGEGPFGQVFLAEHRFLKKLFALKILPEDLDESFLRRFEQQVHAVAALDHPNIVKIHNVSYAEGRAFLVTDPIVDSLGETVNLERYLSLKGSMLAEEGICAILRQTAGALDFAHSKSIEHGALKLSNLLVAPAEEGVKILLSDFALTRLIGEGKSLLRVCELTAKSLMSTEDLYRNFIRAFGFLAPEQKAAAEGLSLSSALLGYF